MVKKISLIILIISCFLYIISIDLNTDIEKVNFISWKWIIENYSSSNTNYRISDTITRKDKWIYQQDCKNFISGLNPIWNKLCWDWICDSIEKEKWFCYEDCNKTILTTTKWNNINIDDSPFGFHPGNANNYSYIQDLWANRSREWQYFIWTWVDSNRDGNYKFNKAVAPTNPEYPSMNTKINYDYQFLGVPENIKILANVCPFRNWWSFKNTEESQIYQNFVERMVERYDWDNNYWCTLSYPDCYNKWDSEYPSTDLINKFRKNPIKYWQMCNQVFDTCEKNDCKNNYSDSFATAMKLTYNWVKNADNSAKVLIAWDSTIDFYPAIYKKLAWKYIDIIDFHRFGENWSYNPKNDFNYLKTSLKDAWFDLSKLEFWITETSTYSWDPVPPNTNIHDSPYQSEKTQASDLIKRYISATSYGIKKVFWAWNIVEWFKKNCSIFDGAWLVYDWCDCNENNIYVCSDWIGNDLWVWVKKLSYYSYKKMTEILNWADWDNIETIQNTNWVYIYKIQKNWKSIRILWNDNKNSKTITLNTSNINLVKITEAIPKYTTWKEVTDYVNWFNTLTKSAVNWQINITLNDVPVFVQEQ